MSEGEGPRVCRCLRTKMQYVTQASGVGWGKPSSTAGFWCVETMTAVGPDDAQATPEACRDGRACFAVDE